MTTPDPFPDTLEQLFGPTPAVAAAEPLGSADPPPAGGAPGGVVEG